MIRKFDLFLLSVLLIAMNAWYLQASYGAFWDNAMRFEVFNMGVGLCFTGWNSQYG